MHFSRTSHLHWLEMVMKSTFVSDNYFETPSKKTPVLIGLTTKSLNANKVIREKSRGEGSLIGQDTFENVSEPKFFF